VRSLPPEPRACWEAFSSIFRADTIEGNTETLQGLLGPLAQCGNISDPTVLHRASRILIGFKPLVKTWATMPTYYWKRKEKHQLLAEVLPSIVGLLLPVWGAAAEAVKTAPHAPDIQAKLELLRLGTVCLRDMLREVLLHPIQRRSQPNPI
jgi:hypothetical protein